MSKNFNTNKCFQIQRQSCVKIHQLSVGRHGEAVYHYCYQNCNRRQTFPQEDDNIKIVRVQDDALWHDRAGGEYQILVSICSHM